MVSIRAIREELATVCATIVGANAFERPVEQFGSPAVMVMPPERIDYHEDSKGGMVMWFPLRIAVSRTQLDTAQDVIDDLISTGTSTSLVDAIDQSGHGAGAYDYAVVDHARNLGQYAEGQLLYLGAELLVEVRA